MISPKYLQSKLGSVKNNHWELSLLYYKALDSISSELTNYFETGLGNCFSEKTTVSTKLWFGLLLHILALESLSLWQLIYENVEII